MTSKKKTQANQQNAKLSEGPQTERGKNNSKANAHTHGISSKEIIIKRGKFKESQPEYDRLLSDLISQCDPISVIESELVGKIADYLWRHKRIVRFESDFYSTQGLVDEDKVKQTAKKKFQDLKPIIIGDEWPDHIDFSLDIIEQILVELKDIIDRTISERSVPPDCEKILIRIFGKEAAEIAATANSLEKIDDMIVAAQEELKESGEDSTEVIIGYDGNGKVTTIKVDKNMIVGGEAIVFPLFAKWLEIQELVEKCKEIEIKEFEIEAKRIENLTPSQAILKMDISNSILRREAFFEKEFYKALHELQRLQAFRLGKPAGIPTAIDLNITGGAQGDES